MSKNKQTVFQLQGCGMFQCFLGGVEICLRKLRESAASSLFLVSELAIVWVLVLGEKGFETTHWRILDW